MQLSSILETGIKGVHPLSAFLRDNDKTDAKNCVKDSNFIDGVELEPVPAYWYEGRCPRTGNWLKLPRTAFVETIAHRLMQRLAQDEAFAGEGKMYGVLLVADASGDRGVLQAFSGLLKGQAEREGWVPPIPGRTRVAQAESQTLAALEAIKTELLALQQLPERQQYETLTQDFALQLQTLADRHAQRKQSRQQRRQTAQATLTRAALAQALEALDDESRRDGMERRDLKRQRDAELQPLRSILERADARIQELKTLRKALSRQLQTQLHAAYALTNFMGQTRSLQEVVANGSMPTGTGDCCAPKLLHYAATHGLKPIAMAEFWWGTATADKIPGAFYEACAERCQPLMGFLLSGLSLSDAIVSPPSDRAISSDLVILYEDEWLIAVNKPSGLLSVPGRYVDRQDSVLRRLQCALWDGANLRVVHRLDLGTSGILLITRDAATHGHLSRQFQQRRVQKVYEALLAGSLSVDQGTIDLPLWRDPSQRPLQTVNGQYGKPSQTNFRVIARTSNQTRVEFIPLTGRTHQLRVHAAAPQGLGIPILGDRLYGGGQEGDRLCLHARELRCVHPQTGELLELHCETPF
ncbi:RluA family pseudouridine synthase [Egbenema bharatensis]|uniref:RluA family pseudouridine synthase n=1 Tax=Egbenema bharatensis TaxID=3463334 RepID=UPI003A897B28